MAPALFRISSMLRRRLWIVVVGLPVAVVASSWEPQPIQYAFPSQEEARRRQQRDGRTTRISSDTSDEALPQTFVDQPAAAMSDDDVPAYATPRGVDPLLQSLHGRLLVAGAASLVGALFGLFVGRSLGLGDLLTQLTAILWFLLSFYRNNPYGDLVQACGLAACRLWQRYGRIRRRYPVWGASQQRPVQEQRLQVLLCLTLIGAVCGSHIPLLPSWMGALAGAASLVVLSQAPNRKGNLVRSLGLRAAALAGEAWNIQDELAIGPKAGKVASRLLDKLLILDRKHRLKDKIVGVSGWAFEQVSRAVSQVQESRDEDDDRLSRRGDRRRYEDREEGDDRRRRDNQEDDMDRRSRRDDDFDRRRRDTDVDRRRRDDGVDRRRRDDDTDRRRRQDGDLEIDRRRREIEEDRTRPDDRGANPRPPPPPPPEWR